MLKEIHIQNYAVVDNLRLEFRPGLTLLSGETGSGKSILVDALNLALGGRASPDVIRTGADRAWVTAIFGVAPEPSNSAEQAGSGAGRKQRFPWSAWLEEYGLAGGDEPEVILRREIQAGGRSRLLVNDQPVTLAAIRALARSLVEVHGQNEHVTLFASEAQLELLDQFGSLEAMANEAGELFARCRELGREFENLNQNEQDRLRTIDLLKFQLQELEGARLQPGEDADLEAKKQVLGNLEKIRAAAEHAFGQLYEEEASACARLASAIRSLEDLHRYDERVGPYREPLAAARATLEDASYFLRDYLGKLEADPGRLEEIEGRLALIDRLKRKYGQTVETMLAYHDATERRLEDLEHADDRRDEVRRQLAGVAAEYDQVARVLSEERRAAARKLQKLVCDELAQLGMEKTRFEIRFAAETRNSKLKTGNSKLETADGRLEAGDSKLEMRNSKLETRNLKLPTDEPFLNSEPGISHSERTLAALSPNAGPRGVDEIELLISPNPGEELRPLEKIASGGELSRLMLALKTVAGRMRLEGEGATRRVAPQRVRQGPVRTFVFDEVDAGIGGRVAESVGLRLKRLAREAQVLCVTHLPQIACFADQHFYVEKIERAGRTVTAVKDLETQKDRVAELARMLSGSQMTEAVLKHAAAMLKHAADDSRR